MLRATSTYIKLTTAVCTVLMLLLPAMGGLRAQVPFTSNKEKAQTREGNKQFKKEAYSEAEANYKKALDKKNNMAEPVFNLGDAVYKQKRYEEAEKQFLQSAQNNTDVKVKAKAYHNLGNCYMEQSKWEEAVKAYKNALKNNPNDADTKYNLAYANIKLREKQQQQQQQQQENKDKNKDQNKDQKDQQDNKNNKDNKDNKDQDGNQQNDQKDNKDQQKQGQQPKLSKEEAEKLLKALNNEEQKTNQKVQQKTMKGAVIKIEKDW